MDLSAESFDLLGLFRGECGNVAPGLDRNGLDGRADLQRRQHAVLARRQLKHHLADLHLHPTVGQQRLRHGTRWQVPHGRYVCPALHAQDIASIDQRSYAIIDYAELR